MLQLHQLKVAGVASIICDNFDKPLDKNSIIAACLLHDMGNILKFNFDIFSDEFFAPEGKDYWMKVKEEFRQKYGDDEHEATRLILENIKVNQSIKDLTNYIGFSQVGSLVKQNNFNKKIRLYADCRVSPFGITSLDKRMEEGSKRYVVQKGKFSAEEFGNLANFAKKLEQQIFEHCKIKPESIIDENVNPLIQELKRVEI